MQWTQSLLDPKLAEHGIASAAELSQRLELFEDPSFFFHTVLTVSTWGPQRAQQ
jgi:hypothetical protein